MVLAAFPTQSLTHALSDICKILLAIILPPVGVFLERGCGADFLINILLTILGKRTLSPPAPPVVPAAKTCTPPAGSHVAHTLPWIFADSARLTGYIPGIIHALYIILKY